MKRRFTIHCVVLATALAASAVGALAASAAEFHSNVQPQPISGTQTTAHSMTTTSGAVTCHFATFSGMTPAHTSTTLTMTRKYGNCTAFGFINVPVQENGCALIFHASGTAEIECPSGMAIGVLVPGCTNYIIAQHIASGVTYTSNAANSDLNIEMNITGLKYYECGGTLQTNGTYFGNTTVTGGIGSIWYT